MHYECRHCGTIPTDDELNRCYCASCGAGRDEDEGQSPFIARDGAPDFEGDEEE